jgi:hypothetical protein
MLVAITKNSIKVVEDELSKANAVIWHVGEKWDNEFLNAVVSDLDFIQLDGSELMEAKLIFPHSWFPTISVVRFYGDIAKAILWNLLS